MTEKMEVRRGARGFLSVVWQALKLDRKQWEEVKVDAYGGVGTWTIVGTITLIGSVIVGAAVLLMRPDVRDALSTPLTIPLGLALLVAAAAIAAPLVVRSVVRRRTVIAERKAATLHVEAASEYARFLTTSKGIVEHDLRNANEALAQRDSEIAQRDAEIRALRDQHEKNVWSMRYDGVLPELRPAHELHADLSNARSGIEDIAIAADDACKKGFALLENLVRRLCAVGGEKETALSELGSLADERVLKRGIRAWRWLQDDIKPRSPDYRDQDQRHSFIGFYYRYQEARLWIFRSARWLNIDLSQLPEYRAWRADDEHLDKSLRKILKRQSLKDVSAYIAVLDKQNGFPAPYPDE